jgi:hypothetical protein
MGRRRWGSGLLVSFIINIYFKLCNLFRLITGASQTMAPSATQQFGNATGSNESHQPEPVVPSGRQWRQATVEDVIDEDGPPVPVTPSRSRPAKHVLFNLPGTPLTAENNIFGSSRRQTAVSLSRTPSSSSNSSNSDEDDTHEDFSDVFGLPPAAHHVAPSGRSRTTPEHITSSRQTTPTWSPGRWSSSPRAGPHSTKKSASPAGNKKNRKAKDVWPFFECENGRRVCIFCQWVWNSELFSSLSETDIINRRIKATNAEHDVTTYGDGSSTGTLRNHLCSEHIDDWVSSCDSMGIPLKAKGIKTAVDNYRQSQGQTTSDGMQKPRRQFSKEAFVDSIIEFIIADDQVSDA